MKNLLITLIMILTIAVKAQVGIGIAIPNPSSQLDVTSTSKGFLPPRMTAAQRDAITNPATGLIIWCSDCGSSVGSLQNYDGSSWINIGSLAITGSNIGDMLYWNGNKWVGLPAGTNGQILTCNNGVPTWTQNSATLPSCITISLSGINFDSAICQSNVSDGAAPITAKGVCWSINENPTITDTHTNDGPGSGIYNSSLTELLHLTTYNVRAYATNSFGTYYGNQLTFTTPAFILYVMVVGGGGGGNGGGGFIFGAGNGGSGGSMNNININPNYTITSHDPISIVIGAGGNGGLSELLGAQGGSSTFGTVTVNGGISGSDLFAQQTPQDLNGWAPSGSGRGGRSGGSGGNGWSCSISGSAIKYSPGGGAGGTGANIYPYLPPGAAGLDGGGNGNSGNATGYGGGGGGGVQNYASPHGVGGKGYQGVIIVRYTAVSPRATGGTVTKIGSDYIHTFTTSGLFSPF